LKLARDFAEREFFRSHLGDDDDIFRPRNPFPVPAKKFSNQPFDSVANDRVAHPGGDRNAQSLFSRVIDSGENDEMGGVDLSSLPREGQKLGTFSQTDSFGKILATAACHRAIEKRFGYLRGRFGGTVTVSRLRPLARLRRSTLRPPGVAMRARNPCVRFRLMLLG
jgi:hypothetical protein